MYPVTITGAGFRCRALRPSILHDVTAPMVMSKTCDFAQFALLTQTAAVFATYMLGFIGSHKMKVVLLGHGLGLAVSFLALFGNSMLLSSFFCAAVITILAIVYMEPMIEKLRIRVLIWVVQTILLGLGTLGTKFLVGKLLGVRDDAHIGDIFRSKFTNFRNFDTMLYTCAAEFSFMDKETMPKLLKTLLVPCTLVVIVVIIYKILKREYEEYKMESIKPETLDRNGDATLQTEQATDNVPIEHRSKPEAELVYHLFQLAAFTAMAVLIMRLKLFWTPHLCLFVSLLTSRQLFGWVGDRKKHYAIIAAIVATMSFQGAANLSHQRSIVGEFSNPPLEELVEWINVKLPPNAVFAGPMPTMATIKLCTGRPIVDHPHYEDAELRRRVKEVYTVYSRKPLEEVWQAMVNLHVNYVIVEMSWCNALSSRGCSMAEIWDIEDETNRGKEKTCTRLHQNPGRHFKRVFRNKIYDVLRVVPLEVLKKVVSPAA
ncbi:putative C-mannosyltransferase DPY19L1 [Lamellibrachia satsuma]|nr:putative C-mannosyltransferase DPY19L1 [Lamellibrachia satsuma]